MHTQVLHVNIVHLQHILSCKNFLIILESRLERIRDLGQPFLDIALKLQQMSAEITSVYFITSGGFLHIFAFNTS